MQEKQFLTANWRNSRTKGTQKMLYDKFKQSQLTRNKKQLISFTSILVGIYSLQTVYSFIFPHIYSIRQQLAVVIGAAIFFTAYIVFLKLRRKRFKKIRVVIDVLISISFLSTMVYYQVLNMFTENSASEPAQQHFILAIHELFRFSCALISVYLLIDTWWIRSLLFSLMFLICTGGVIYWGPHDTAIVGDLVLFSISASLGVWFFSYLWHKNEVGSFKEIGYLLEKDAVWKLIVDGLPVSMAIINTEAKFLFNNFSFKNLFQGSLGGFSEDSDKEKNCEALFRRVRLKNYKDPKCLLTRQRRDSSTRLSPDVSALTLRKRKTSKSGLSAYGQGNGGDKDMNLWEYTEKLFQEFSRESIQEIYEEEEEEKLILITVSGILDKNVSLEINLGFLMFDGEPGVIYFLNDTTMSARVAKLEGNCQFKSNLFHSLSHEFRTPMNGSMILLKEMARDESIAKEIKQKYIDPVVLNLQRLLLMIRSMGDYSLISQKLSIQLSCKPFNIRKFLHKVMKVINYESEKKQLQLSLEIDESAPIYINSDKERLGRILLSVLENAIKFTFEGSVKLSVKPGFFRRKRVNNFESLSMEQLEMHFGTPKSDSDLQGAIFVVEDTGIGMTEQQLNNLRGILQRGEFEQKVSSDSTGASLGLTLANELAKALGEELVFSSVEGKGTKVSFSVFSQWFAGSSAFGLDFREEQFMSMSSQFLLDNEKIEHLNLNKVHLYTFDMKKSRQSPLVTMRELEARTAANTRNSLAPLLQSKPHYPLKESGIISNSSKVPDLTVDTPKECDCPQVLIVDDDPFNVDSVKTILTKIGVRVAEAYNGKIAVELALKISNQHQNNCRGKCGGLKLILMDVNMPVMDGCKATSVIRSLIAQKKINQLVIIGCTAYDKPEVHISCIEVGMDEVEIKPLKPEKLKKFWAVLQKT